MRYIFLCVCISVLSREGATLVDTRREVLMKNEKRERAVGLIKGMLRLSGHTARKDHQHVKDIKKKLFLWGQ